MKFRHFASAIAALALAGCSNDDVVLDNNNQQQEVKDAAYMKVNVGYVGNGFSRATTGSYQEGSADEHNIYNAYFYFYNPDGSYNQVVSKTAEQLKNKGADDATQKDNVEYLISPVLVLENQNNKTPKYMVVVLNQPEDVNLAGKKLSDATQEITALSYSAETTNDQITNNNTFVMTNTTYVGETIKGDKYQTTEAGEYYATPLTENDFYEEEEDAENLQPEQAVDVYVERLAAKVSVDEYPTPDVKANGINNLTVEIKGWALNGTEKQSYLMKNINANWRFSANATDANKWTIDWNKATDHRSYWGKSVHYDYNTNNYPENYSSADKEKETVKDKDGEEEEEVETGNVDGTKYVLNYINWNEVNNAQTSSLYCNENTLSTDHYDELTSAATSILIAAQIKVNNEAKNLYRWGTNMWTESDIIESLMEETVTITTEGNTSYHKLSDYWKEANEGTITTTDGTMYAQIDDTYFKFVSAGDGYVNIQLNNKEEEEDSKEKIVWGTITTVANDDKTFNANPAVTLDNVIDEINNMLANSPINGYKDGMMYYNIPIEHLGAKNPDYSTDDYTGHEGDYGVVRNHWYKIKINEIKNLGKGVFDPKEDIIPNEQESKLWYLAAEIKVLSWHIVDQEVDL